MQPGTSQCGIMQVANTGIVVSKVGSVQCQLASTDESEMTGIKVDPPYPRVLSPWHMAGQLYYVLLHRDLSIQ